MRRRRRSLSEEEARLWASVARQTVPLRGRRPAVADPVDQGASAPSAAAEPLRPYLAAPALAPEKPKAPSVLTQHPIERPTRRKIAKGRLPIEARIDLHEMTQSVAHDALAGFLRQAQAMGLRHVLVITGRGGPSAHSGGRGVLRRQVPLWFAGSLFRPLVSGFESAERHHGGEGAFYVRVRRLR